MRSVRIATWTSGDPVSVAPRALSLMISCLRSAVTDIVYPFDLEVEAAHHPDLGAGFVPADLHKRDRNGLVGRKMEAPLCGNPDQNLPLAEQPCLIGGDG